MEAALLADARGDNAHAIAWADEAVAMEEGKPGFDLPTVRRASIEQHAGLFSKAQADGQRALELFAEKLGKEMQSANIADAHMAIGRAQAALGALAEARDHFSAAEAHYTPTLGAQNDRTGEAHRRANAAP